MASKFSITFFLALLLLTTEAQTTTKTYDYAIAGGGTAGLLLGLTLAKRSPNSSILVLEAGQSSATDPRALVPENEGALVSTPFDWNFTTVPQRSLYNSATISVPRGKTLGGSSALNFLIWARPSKTELDGYASVLGLQGWNWASLLPAFEESENFTDPPRNLAGVLTVDDTVHGRAGLIDGSMEKAPYSLYTDYVIPALKSLGVPKPVDRTAGNTTGCGFVPLNINAAKYTRSWPGSMYAENAKALPNLEVRTGALVSRVLWDQTTLGSGSARATGLAYTNTSSGGSVSISAKNVILSAGAIQTPQLLELSGVGDPTVLTPLGIKSTVNLPAVGTQATDHLTYAGSFSFNISSFTNGQYVQDFQDYPGPSRFLSASDYAFASGLLANDANKPAGTSNATWQMVKYLWKKDDPFIEFGWYYGFLNSYVLHPLSQGTVHAASADTSRSPNINTGYNSASIKLSNGTTFNWDLWVLSKAIQYYATTLAAAKPLASIQAQFSVKGSLAFPDFQQRVFQGLGSGSHQTGGAVMLPQKAGGVVDGNLKVYGTQNLHVADASVLPVSPGEHTMGVIYAVAIKAADFLLGT